MKHLLDWWTTKCSCRWWGCKICNASNRLISLHNDLIKFWLSVDKVKENLKLIQSYLDKIDSYTLYEYLSWAIDEEAFNVALTEFSPKKIYKRTKKDEVVDTSKNVNPEKKHKFNWDSIRDRCVYCNCIRKYCWKEDCPKYEGE